MPRPPINVVNSVKTVSYGGVLSTFDPINYVVDVGDQDQLGRIILNPGSVWPADLRPFMAIQVNFDAGYVTVGDVITLPVGLKILIFKVLNWLDKNRGDSVPEDALSAGGFMPSIQQWKVKYL
jgi:hypothetical protein